jgi:hypothetical protein
MDLSVRENPVTMSAPAERRARGWALLGLALAMGVCVGVRLYMVRHAEVIARDGAVYIQMAREWLDHPQHVVQDYDYHVGYPAAIAWMHKAMVAGGMEDDFAGWERAACAVSLLATMAAMTALWLFAGLTFNWPIACMTVLLFSVPRKWAGLGADAMSDALALAFQLWSAALTLVAMSLLRKTSPWAILAAAAVGLCAGAGYLVRPEALLMLVLAIGLWGGWQIFDRRLKWRLTVASVVVAIVATLACALPYMLAIGALTKKKRLSDIVLGPAHGLLPLAVANPPDHSSLFQLGLQLVEAMHPVLFTLAALWLIAWGLFRLLTWGQRKPFTPEPQVAGGLFTLAAAVAIVLIMLRLYASVGYLDYRHVMLLGMLLTPLAGAAIYLGANVLADLLFHSSAKARTALLCALTPLATVSMAGQLGRPLHEGKSHYRKSGVYLARIVKPGDRLLAHDPWIFYYSRVKGDYIYIQGMTGKAFLNFIRSGKPAVTYLALSDDEMQTKNPELIALLRPPMFRELSPPSPVLEQREHPTDAIHIWRIDRNALPAARSGR